MEEAYFVEVQVALTKKKHVMKGRGFWEVPPGLEGEEADDLSLAAALAARNWFEHWKRTFRGVVHCGYMTQRAVLCGEVLRLVRLHNERFEPNSRRRFMSEAIWNWVCERAVPHG